jgi:hypothetical protein
MRTFMQRIREMWQPKELTPPTVDSELTSLSAIERSAEVTRYSILSLEWWLSPKGTLREWLRLHSKLGCFLLIPALLILPLGGFICLQIAGCIGSLVSIATNLILFPLAVLIALVVTMFVVSVIRTFIGK